MLARGFLPGSPLEVKLARHLHGQRTPAAKDLGCARSRTEQHGEVRLAAALLFHAIADGFHRVPWVDRPALSLIGLDQRREHVEAVSLR